MSQNDLRPCVACESHDLIQFYEANDIPVDTGSLAKTEREAKEAACGRMTLVFCRTCGVVHNHSFDPRLIRFEPGYDASLYHSQTFAKALRNTVEKLVSMYQLEGKSILEIGCGQAHLLREICERIRVNAIGIDPTSMDTTQSIGSSQLRLIQSRFCNSHREYLGDLVICISVIEDIEEPLRFLRMLRSMIGDRNTNLYFELFDGFGAIEAGNVWSPHYEQCNYFSEIAIRHVFHRSGFKVTRIGRLNENDQYFYLSAESSDRELIDTVDLCKNQLAIERFSDEAQKSIGKWSKQFAEWTRSRKRVFLWGSGGKAISLLSSILEADAIQAVVDINPNRQGLYTPKSAKRVISPEELREERPDIIVMSNSAYRCEIESEIRHQGLNCQLVPA